ncbi:MAG TPA: chemotaxis protein CheW [Roseiflexaceae bacterium]|nr:chemotaxis protein CheW [Roseiflexaceae bacterium]
MDVLLLRLDQEIYALPSSNVREVFRHRPITPVPGAPPALPGILNQRGAILPVIDPRLLLGLVQSPVTRSTRLVLASHEDVDVALLVDGVLDLVALSSDTVEAVPPALDPARARMIRGVARHDAMHVILLDLGELIAAVRDWS